MNDFYAGKPAWFRDYAHTAVKAAISRMQEAVPGTGLPGRSAFYPDLRPTPMAEHIVECDVKEVFYLVEDAEKEWVLDSFDSNASTSIVEVSFQFSCDCGKYNRESGTVKANIADLVESAFRS